MAKATHKGTCQVCGSVQKLPNGRLSKHGYTTRFSFFEGVCAGAGELPFEQSIDLIQGYIDDSRDCVETLHAELADPTYYINSYYHRGTGRMDKSEYRSVHVPVDVEDAGKFNRACSSVIVNGVQYPAQNNYPAGFVNQLISTTTYSHTRLIKQLNEYIEWQEGRITDWTPTDLIEL